MPHPVDQGGVVQRSVPKAILLCMLVALGLEIASQVAGQCNKLVPIPVICLSLGSRQDVKGEENFIGSTRGGNSKVVLEFLRRNTVYLADLYKGLKHYPSISDLSG